MRRVATTLWLALCLLGCGLTSPAGEPVPLLTGWGPFQPTGNAWQGVCYTSAALGVLMVDPEYGTAITDHAGGGSTADAPRSPVMWRPGYTGRRIGSEIAVLDPAGKVVAVTGTAYRLEGGYWSETIIPTKENHYSFSGPRAFIACGSVTPQ